MIKPLVTMVQDGARRHYMVPVALQMAGVLERMYCDWYVQDRQTSKLISRLIKQFQPSLGQRMLDRCNQELDSSKVFDNPLLTIRSFLKRTSFGSTAEYYRWIAKVQHDWIAKSGFGNSSHLYAFLRSASPELFETAKNRGLKVIGDQMIVPAVVERREYEIQQQRFPGWEMPISNEAFDFAESFELQSWDSCDYIVCGSEYVANGLKSCGVANNRIAMISYGPIGMELPFIERQLSASPILVGFVGSINLRKGTPYFFEVAKRFDPAKVKFVMLGKSSLNPEILQKEKGAVELAGSVARSEIIGWLSRFHIFFFPSTCEGSAGAVIEAMDTGLPIVTTINSGSMVRDGIDGFVLDYDDIDGFTEKIQKLVDDAELRIQMGLSSRKQIEACNLNWYSRALKNMLLDNRVDSVDQNPY